MILSLSPATSGVQQSRQWDQSDASLTIYADDIAKILVLQQANDVRSICSEAALASITYCQECLDEELAAAGIAQHRSKAKILPTFIGQGSFSACRHVLSTSTSRASGKHLGGMQAYNNSNTSQVAARIRAMWAFVFTLVCFGEYAK